MSNVTTTLNYDFNVTGTMLPEKANWWCFVIPFCDTTGCNLSDVHNPTSCSDCSAGVTSLLFIILVAMAIFIIIGNTGIILVIIKNPIFHNPFNMFKCSLAVADLLVGILVVPAAVVETVIILMAPFDKEEVDSGELHVITGDGDIVMRGTLCARIHREETSSFGFFMSIIGVLSIMASIFNLVLLSIDRFLAVMCPIKYNQGRAINNRTAAFLILLVWCICVILSAVIPAATGPAYFTYGLTPAMVFTLKTMDGYAGFFYAMFALALPFLALVGLNVGTGVMLFRKRTKLLKRTATNPKNGANSSNHTRRSNEVKASVTLMVMVLVFTISTIPSLITVMVYNDLRLEGEQREGHTEGSAFMALVLLLVSNSAWNFIIYSWRNDNFRKALRKLVCGVNGKDRRLRWKKVKMVALGRSDKKRRRKKFAKSTSRDKFTSDEKQVKITTVQGNVENGRIPTTSIPADNRPRSVVSNGSSQDSSGGDHRSLRYMRSISSDTSTSSNPVSATTLMTSVAENGQKSPIIVEENEFFFRSLPEETEKIAKEDSSTSSNTENHPSSDASDEHKKGDAEKPQE